MFANKPNNSNNNNPPELIQSSSLDDWKMLVEQRSMEEEIEMLKANQKELEEKADLAEEWKKGFEAKSEQLKKMMGIVGSFKEESDRSDEIRKKLEEEIEKSAGLEKEIEEIKERIEGLMAANSGLFHEKNNLERDAKNLQLKLYEAEEMTIRLTEKLSKKQSVSNRDETEEWRRRIEEIIKKKNEEKEKLKLDYKKKMEEQKTSYKTAFDAKLNILKTTISEKETTIMKMEREIEKLSLKIDNLEQNNNIEQQQINEKDQIIMELSSRIMRVQDAISEEPFGSQTINLPNKFGYTLQDFHFMKANFDMDSLLKAALEKKEEIVSTVFHEDILQMINKEYQFYEEMLRDYQRAIDMNIQLLETPHGHLGFAIPLPVFPQLDEFFNVEVWMGVSEENTQKNPLY